MTRPLRARTIRWYALAAALLAGLAPLRAQDVPPPEAGVDGRSAGHSALRAQDRDNAADASTAPIDDPTARANESAPPLPDAADSPFAPYREIRRFDFDERPLGNFEDTPIGWARFDGPGLPFYSTGEFDLEIGRAAPPSFRLDLRGGNIGYEYFRDDLTVSPNSDYRVVGHFRTDGLEYARALLAVYLVDRAGQRIPGTTAVSRAVASAAPGPDANRSEWHPVWIDLSIDDPQAYALRLQVWVLQDHVWRDPPDGALDPITRQDVGARVWLDDLGIHRLPRVRVALSHPASIVLPGRRESVEIDVHNATLRDVTAELTVRDEHGAPAFEFADDIAPNSSQHLTVPLPGDLPTGRYETSVRLAGGAETLLERRLHFAVLAALSESDVRYEDFGVDLGAWRGGDVPGAAALVAALRCGSSRVGVAMIGTPDDERKVRYLDEIRELARQLVLQRIDTTGIILPPSVFAGAADPGSTFELMTSDRDWQAQFGPVFAYVGDLLFNWQLGAECSELRGPRTWTTRSFREAGRKLERFVAVPQLVVPRSIRDAAPVENLPDYFGAAPALARPPSRAESERPAEPRFYSAADLARDGPYAYSFWLPADIPAHALPWHLAFWFEGRIDRASEGAGLAGDVGGAARWLAIEINRDPHLRRAERLADLARRIVLAKAVNPDRLYVEAPFRLTATGGAPTWEPTDEYIAVRTLFHYLSGRRPIAALRLPNESAAVLFTGPEVDTLVLWTWQQGGDPPEVDLWVGREAYGVDLTGRRHALARRDRRARIPLTPEPLIVENVDAALLLLQDSFDVSPDFIQMHEPEPRPVLRMTNHFDERMVANIRLRSPERWAVTPDSFRVSLAPGETLEEPLTFRLPPREAAARRTLRVDVELVEPGDARLEFEVPLRVGLRDIRLASAAWWQGDDLVVEQTLHNDSQSAVSFSGFCQPPGRPQQEGVFLDVAPRGRQSQLYVIRAARALADASVWVGIEEIDGPRALDQLVPIPP